MDDGSAADLDVAERDDGTVEIVLPAEARSATIARRYVNRRWAQLEDDVLDDTAPIVTELVANAVKYGAPEICLRLRAQPFSVDVAVLDHGPGWPQRKSSRAPGREGSGRGLAIVEKLSVAWGVDPVEDGRQGKLVWASVDRC